MADTASQDFSVSGNDDDPTVLTVNASDITVNNGGEISAVTLSTASLQGTFSDYCGSWYDFTLVVDGETVVANGCASDMMSIDLTGFTSFSITSADSDVYSDFITISVGLSVEFTPLAGAGCTDMAACNYDETATLDDGTCTYADAGFDCEGNCLEGTFTTIDVQEISTGGWTYTLVGYGGSWSMTDLSTGESAASTSSDNVSNCFADGCYEISGFSGSGGSYAFAYSLNGGDNITPGEFGQTGTDYIEIGESSCAAYTGCTDIYADNFDETALISDNSICEYSVTPGCIDMTACNYDPAATVDDGSCTFAAEGFDCDGACLSGTLVEYSSGSYAGENSFTITDCDGTVLASMASGYDGFSSCVELPDFYFVNLSDSYGDGWNGGALTIGGVSYTIDAGGAWSGFDFESFAPNGNCPNVIYSAGSYAGENSFTITDCDGNVLASMASGYDGFSGAVELPDNYNISLFDSYGDGWNGGALVVDGVTYTIDAGGAWSGFDSESFLVGSCGLPGCTDVAACNYNADAELEDGSCTYATETVDCDGNCIVGSPVTISLTDSYGDGWNGGSLNVAGVEYTQVGSYGWPYSEQTETFTACVDLDTCIEVVFTAGSWSYENSWSISDADGNVLASGANENGFLGCPTGCTNPLANNFDLEAIVDDGSCLVCLNGEEVSDSNLPLGELPDDVITITITTGNPPFAYSGEIHWELYNNGNELIVAGGNALTIGNTSAGGFASGDYDDGEVYERTTGCLPDGCYKLITYDTYGDGWNNNGTFGVTNQFGAELVPTTVMGPNVGYDEDGMGYLSYPQQLATYFSIGDASCETYGCTDELASNYDAEATVDDESCIYCDENSVDVSFAFNQENITSDEVYVYNQETNDTVFSVEPFELPTWAGKDTLTCVPVGCYIVSMGATSSSGWTDGSQLQILDDLTSDYFLLEVDGGSLDLQVVSIGGAVCTVSPVGGCMDPLYDNYNPDATYDNGSCAYTCQNAVASNTVSVEEDADSAPYSYVTSDPAGFGAVVTFEVTESDADIIYHIFDCDSTQFTNFNPNSLSIEIEAGVSLYFAAVDAWNTDSVGTIVATVTELPDSLYWGCMDEIACNYDSLATYEPSGSCEFAEVGLDCDGNEFPAYFDVELDYSTSGDLCNFANDYNDGTVGFEYPNSSWTNDGGDMGYAFVSDGSSVSVSLSVITGGSWTDGQLNIYNGNPLDVNEVSTLVTNLYQNTNVDFSLNTIFETDSGSTYFVILDSDNWDCYEFELSINSLEGVGGCIDELACNYNDSADYDNFTCVYPADGFDCDGNFIGSACGTDNALTDSIIVGTGYANNMYQVYVYPSDGVTPVSILWTSGDTENNYDEFAIYDGVGEDAINSANLITEIEDNLPGQYVEGFGNGLTVLWSSDGSVNGDESFGNLVWEVYCADFIYGCMDTLALNYDPLVNMDDGSCSYDFVWGCIDELACNYADTADVDDGSCFYPEEGFDCEGVCLEGSNITLSLFDSYGDGWNGGTLELDGVIYTVNFNDNNGDFAIFELCLDLDACYDVTYTAGSWSSENSWTVADSEGVIASGGNFSGLFGSCGTFGCTDPSALNYDETVDFEDGSCEYPVALAVELNYFVSSTTCNHVNDYDATNTASTSTWVAGEDNGYYFTAENGSVLVNLVQEETGTAQPGLFVYDGDPLDSTTVEIAQATGFSGSDLNLTFNTNDSTTYYVVVDGTATWGCYGYDLTLTQVYSGCMDTLAMNYNPSATVDDGSCEYDFVWGCTDELACNYVDTADVNDGSCIYPASEFVDCDGNCLFSTVTVSLTESYGDGTAASVSMNGNVVVSGVGTNTACVDLEGCASFTYNGNGEYWTVEDSWTVSVDSEVVIDAGGYGFLFGSETIEYGASCAIAGCTDMLACNYDSLATINNGSCSYAQAGYDCDGLCLVDTDEDGICDEFEVAGCTDPYATNYDPSATDDDGTCEACEDNSVALVMNDSWGDGWNGATFTMSSSNNSSISASLYPTSYSSTEQLCVPAGCYEVTVGGGAYDYEITFSLGDYLVNVPSGTYSDIAIGGAICNPMVVNFSVDMSSTAQPNMTDYDNVVINGTWNGWQGWGVVLSDDDNDNVWTGTGEFDPAIGQFEYVVAVTGPTDGYSGWGMQWGACDATNFIVIFEDEVSSYTATPDLDCPEPTVFNVDMSCAGVEFSTVHLTGPIWGWTTDIIMSDDDGDGIYSIAIDGLSGNVEYKYMVDYWAGQEDLVDDMVNGATCAPITDYATYANRLVPAGSSTSDTYGSCSECGTPIPGCTDEAASNYNPAATEDDGSCEYCDAVTVNFSVDAGNVVSGDYDNVVINGSFANWYGWGVTLSDEDADGIYTGSTTVEANVVHEYVHALTGPADGWSGWGVIGFAPEACQLGVSETTGDPSPNYFFSGECGEVIDLPTVCFGECTECAEPVLGCTDASADNFDPNATEDDGSCTYCSSFEAVLLGTSDVSEAGASDGSVQATGQGGSNNYDISVVDG
ncbi:MAG: hypothetical protein ISP71_03830, partial [Flavobacteriales bacterium]|nr:hypothetical protein [Flavobacteriales bacterium]